MLQVGFGGVRGGLRSLQRRPLLVHLGQNLFFIQFGQHLPFFDRISVISQQLLNDSARFRFYLDLGNRFDFARGNHVLGQIAALHLG